jgi:hypothetical protein
VRRIVLELKTVEMGGKGCIMYGCIIYTACHVVGYQRTVAKWVRNVACMGVKVILNRFLVGILERKSPFRRPKIILKLIFKEQYQDGFRLFMLQQSIE